MPTYATMGSGSASHLKNATQSIRKYGSQKWHFSIALGSQLPIISVCRHSTQTWHSEMARQWYILLVPRKLLPTHYVGSKRPCTHRNVRKKEHATCKIFSRNVSSHQQLLQHRKAWSEVSKNSRSRTPHHQLWAKIKRSSGKLQEVSAKLMMRLKDEEQTRWSFQSFVFLKMPRKMSVEICSQERTYSTFQLHWNKRFPNFDILERCRKPIFGLEEWDCAVQREAG